nr:MAG TPA: hypothetical protein [Caudoviricetes sp.]
MVVCLYQLDSLRHCFSFFVFFIFFQKFVILCGNMNTGESCDWKGVPFVQSCGRLFLMNRVGDWGIH